LSKAYSFVLLPQHIIIKSSASGKESFRYLAIFFRPYIYHVLVRAKSTGEWDSLAQREQDCRLLLYWSVCVVCSAFAEHGQIMPLYSGKEVVKYW